MAGVLLSAILSGQDRDRKASRLCAVGVGRVFPVSSLGASPARFPSATNATGVPECPDPDDHPCPGYCDRHSSLRVPGMAETPDCSQQDGLRALGRLGEPAASGTAGRVGFLVVAQVTSEVFPLADPRRDPDAAGVALRPLPGVPLRSDSRVTVRYRGKSKSALPSASGGGMTRHPLAA